MITQQQKLLIKEKLFLLSTDISDRVKNLESHITESTIETSDEVEQVSLEIEQEKFFQLREKEIHYLKQINSAMQKIDNQDFGECEECGGNISFERLKARPWASMCIECKDTEERNKKQKTYVRNESVFI